MVRAWRGRPEARYAIEPDTAVFIDDNGGNVEAAARLGLIGLRFVDARTLRRDMVRLGLLT